MARSKHYDSIKQEHDRVERHGLFVDMLNNRLTNEELSLWCYIKHKIYAKLDILFNNKYPDISIKKAKDFYIDMRNLQQTYYKFTMFPELQKYLDHITEDTIESIAYLHYYADMHGGQLIAKKIPQFKVAYTFENRVETLQKLLPIVNSIDSLKVQQEFVHFEVLLDSLYAKLRTSK